MVGVIIRLIAIVVAAVAALAMWIGAAVAFLVAVVRLRPIGAAGALVLLAVATIAVYALSSVDLDSWVHAGRLRRYPPDDEPPLFV